MKLSIGILAYNEADSISITLHSLFQQSLFNQPHSNQDIEVVVVPNGCTDNTAAISKDTLQELVKSSTHPNICWKVCEVEQPGKPNAWNLYVHQFSDPVADYLILMDADIQFLELCTLQSLIDTLEVEVNAWVSVDTLVKDLVLKKKKNLIEKLSIAVSKVSGARSAWISGQLYCGRATMLRQIWMPLGVIVEDGFLWEMVTTDCLTSPEVLSRVVLADSASHIFEAYININSLLRHEVRQVIGNTINSFIYNDLKTNCNRQQDVGSFVKLRNEQDPLWLNRLIQTTVAHKGWWVVSQWLLLRRFISLRNAPLYKAVFLLPISCIAFLVDLLVCFQANSELHKWSRSSYGTNQPIDSYYWRLDW